MWELVFLLTQDPEHKNKTNGERKVGLENKKRHTFGEHKNFNRNLSDAPTKTLT